MKKSRILISVILLFLTASIIIFFTGIFNIKTIDVVGNATVPKDEIINNSGLEYGKNIFLFFEKTAIRGIFKDAYIKLVKIDRKLPSKVVISVIERIAAFKIPYVGSNVILDEEGVVLEVLPIGGEIFDLPVVVGLRFSDFKVGESLTVENKTALDTLMKVIKEIRPSDLLQGMTKIDITDINNVSLSYRDGNTILLGEPVDIAYKLSFAKSILEDIKKKNRRGIIDFSNNGEPVFKPVK